MPGTITKQLTQTGQTDGTTGTAANTGFTVVTPGSGNTVVHADAAKMGLPAGIRATQGGANQNTNYLDDTAARTIFAGNVPFSAPTPTANATVIRWFPDTGHATNLGSLLLTTTRRLQFVEGGAGTPLNVTSASGTPYTADADYLIQYKIDVTANTFALRMYPWGNLTELLSFSGTLGADMAAAAGVQSLRWGINTASALTYIDTNSGFAFGSGDWLDRPDVANTPPTVSLGTGSSGLEAGTTRTITITATDTDGTIASYAVTRVSGPSVTFAQVGSTNVFTYEVPALYESASLVYNATATDDDGASTTSSNVTDVILPHDQWSRSATGTLVPVLMFPAVP